MQKTLTTRCAAVALAIASVTMAFGTGANAKIAFVDGVTTDLSAVSGDQNQFILSRRGADDPAGDDRRGRGRGTDDGPNHATIDLLKGFETARRGADDPAGDDRGGRGRGKDDGANHATIELLKSFETARRGRGRDDGPNHA